MNEQMKQDFKRRLWLCDIAEIHFNGQAAIKMTRDYPEILATVSVIFTDDIEQGEFEKMCKVAHSAFEQKFNEATQEVAGK